jgi:DNA-binding NtrC family response regulator
MLQKTVDRVIKELIIFGLKKSKGNVMQTARYIGRTTQQTYNLIRKHNINLARYRK